MLESIKKIENQTIKNIIKSKFEYSEATIKDKLTQSYSRVKQMNEAGYKEDVIREAREEEQEKFNKFYQEKYIQPTLNRLEEEKQKAQQTRDKTSPDVGIMNYTKELINIKDIEGLKELADTDIINKNEFNYNFFMKTLKNSSDLDKNNDLLSVYNTKYEKDMKTINEFNETIEYIKVFNFFANDNLYSFYDSNLNEKQISALKNDFETGYREPKIHDIK